ERQGPEREEDAGGAADEREEEVLGEELPDQAPAAGAQRATDGDLRLARHAAREEQAPDVGAADEEEQADGDGERDERAVRAALEIAEELLPERHDPVAPAAPELRMLHLQPACQTFQLGVALRDGDAGREPADER